MNRLLFSLIAILATANIFAADKTITVKLSNPMSVARHAVPVVISVDNDVCSALVTIDGKEIPCQLDDMNDDGLFEELSFVVDMKKKEKLTATVTLSTEGEPRQYDAKTYGALAIRDRDKSAKTQKHMPITSVTCPASSNTYQYIFPHGAIMESDMVGFRVYADHRQSIDYYGHKQLKCDIAETSFYPTKEQKAAGSGDDVLYTGTTYGCGALHGWDGKTAVMFENVRNRTYTVVTSGPVRTVVDITNRGWQPQKDCKSVDIRTRYILYAGHRDVEVDVKFSRPVADIPLSTGIVDIVEGSEEFTDKAGLRGCWGTACAGNNPKVYDTHTVGLGVYVPKQYYKSDSHFTDKDATPAPKIPNQAYAQVVGTTTDHLNYWFAVTCDMECFSLSGESALDSAQPSKDAWFAWLKQWKQQLSAPVSVVLN